MTEENQKLDLVKVQSQFNPVEMDRITAQLAVHVEQEESGPVTFASNYTKSLMPKATDEPWKRTFKVSVDPVKLDLGWCAELPLHCLILENLAGTVAPKVQISAEEKAEIAKKRIEMVAMEMHIDPGTFIVIQPDNAKALRVCCPAGDNKIRITAIPKGE